MKTVERMQEADSVQVRRVEPSHGAKDGQLVGREHLDTLSTSEPYAERQHYGNNAE
jgi:hypothetical protein